MPKRPPKRARSRRRRTRRADPNPRTVLLVAILEAPRAISVDDEIWNALLYTVALHSHATALAIHDVRLDEEHFTVALTGPAATLAEFRRAVARDFEGFLSARLGERVSCRTEAPIPLDDLWSQMAACAGLHPAQLLGSDAWPT